jgi:hypothetical protein
MKIVPFEPNHLERLLLQPSQAIMQETLTRPEYAKSLYEAGPAYSLVDGDAVFASMGLIPQWEHRAIAWGLIAKEAGPHFRTIHKAVLRTMEIHPYRRIETSVACDFEQGHRWARMLGFEREGRMRAFTPDGHDCDLYGRIQ